MTITNTKNESFLNFFNGDEIDLITLTTFKENFEFAKASRVPYYLFEEVQTETSIRAYEHHSFNAFLQNQLTSNSQNENENCLLDPLRTKIKQINTYALECFQIKVNDASNEQPATETNPFPNCYSFPTLSISTVMEKNELFDLGCFIDATNPNLSNSPKTIFDHSMIIDEFIKMNDYVEAFRWTVSLDNKIHNKDIKTSYEYSFNSLIEKQKLILKTVENIFQNLC